MRTVKLRLPRTFCQPRRQYAKVQALADRRLRCRQHLLQAKQRMGRARLLDDGPVELCGPAQNGGELSHLQPAAGGGAARLMACSRQDFEMAVGPAAHAIGWHRYQG